MASRPAHARARPRAAELENGRAHCLRLRGGRDPRAGLPRERGALREYGEELGLAFQIADDLLDAEGDAAKVGKATGKDSTAGKATLIGLLGIPKARTLLGEAEQQAIAALKPFDVRAEILIEAARFAASRAH